MFYSIEIVLRFIYIKWNNKLTCNKLKNSILHFLLLLLPRSRSTAAAATSFNPVQTRGCRLVGCLTVSVLCLWHWLDYSVLFKTVSSWLMWYVIQCLYLLSNNKQKNGRSWGGRGVCQQQFWYKQKCEEAWQQKGKLFRYLFLMWQALMPVLLVCTISDQEDCFQKEALN